MAVDPTSSSTSTTAPTAPHGRTRCGCRAATRPRRCSRDPRTRSRASGRGERASTRSGRRGDRDSRHDRRSDDARPPPTIRTPRTSAAKYPAKRRLPMAEHGERSGYLRPCRAEATSRRLKRTPRGVSFMHLSQRASFHHRAAARQPWRRLREAGFAAVRSRRASRVASLRNVSLIAAGNRPRVERAAVTTRRPTCHFYCGSFLEDSASPCSPGRPPSLLEQVSQKVAADTSSSWPTVPIRSPWPQSTNASTR